MNDDNMTISNTHLRYRIKLPNQSFSVTKIRLGLSLLLLLSTTLKRQTVHVASFPSIVSTVIRKRASNPSSLGFSSISSNNSPKREIAPETTDVQRQAVRRVLDLVYGHEKSDEWENRRFQARASGEEDGTLNVPQHELVYGELGLDALATILDAVGVIEGDRFMDIGSGDGMLVSAASMLFSDFLDSSSGIEIVPELYERSLSFQNNLEQEIVHQQSKELDDDQIDIEKIELCGCMSLDLGNVYDPNDRIKKLFSETTLAVCFATTWSKGSLGRKLPQLSETLGKGGKCELPRGARLVIVDGVLDHDKDGYLYKGQFKLFCPDTAPFSLARLYVKK